MSRYLKIVNEGGCLSETHTRHVHEMCNDPEAAAAIICERFQLLSPSSPRDQRDLAAFEVEGSGERFYLQHASFDIQK